MFLARGRLGTLQRRGILSHQSTGIQRSGPQVFSINSAGRLPVCGRRRAMSGFLDAFRGRYSQAVVAHLPIGEEMNLS
jgi:hypothetical protein